MLDARILGEASATMRSQMNSPEEKTEYLQDEIDQKYKEFERLENG